MSNKNDAEIEFELLKENKFKQQKLPAWRPVPTITSTSLTFLFFGIAFIVIGIIVLVNSNKIVEVSQRYDDICGNKLSCPININVPQDMTSPIMVYYQLNNFYQNHRRYVKSKSNSQLIGNIYSKEELQKASDCDPIYTMKDLGQTKVVNLTTVPDDFPANPCGLIAKSLFNDTYNLNFSNGTKIEINSTNIAWQADKDLKYKRAKDPNNPSNTDYWKSVSWTDVEDEHFMVWMRPAGLPNFRKLWGRINQNIANGTYIVNINNNYNVTPFNGTKLIVLSTVNSFGGKNSFLGISYIVVGSICVIMAIAFVIGYKIHNNQNKTD
jgi:hypothetical protein